MSIYGHIYDEWMLAYISIFKGVLKEAWEVAHMHSKSEEFGLFIAILK